MRTTATAARAIPASTRMENVSLKMRLLATAVVSTVSAVSSPVSRPSPVTDMGIPMRKRERAIITRAKKIIGVNRYSAAKT